MRLLRRRPAARPEDPGAPHLGPRIALWGTFDIADYAALLRPRILERELLARLSLARIDIYSPLGHEHPIAMDGGRPAIPLGSPTGRRKQQLALRHDLIVVTGDVIHPRDEHYQKLYGPTSEQIEPLRPSEFFVDGLGSELERRCPVVWSAVGAPFDLSPDESPRVRSSLDRRPHVSVRDDRSRDRLLATGTGKEIAVVPDPTILASRLFPPDVLRKRVDYLRVLGCYPQEGRPVVVQRGAARDVSAHLQDETVLLADLEAGDAASTDEVEAVGNLFPLPASATVEDVTAAIANAKAFVGPASSVATAFGVPSSAPNASDRVDLQGRMDAELDAVAEFAERSWAKRAAQDERTPHELAEALVQSEERYQALLEAHAARGERLVSERMRFAEIVERLDASNGTVPPGAAEQIAELENAIFTAHATEAEMRVELDRLREQRNRDA